MLVLNIEYWSMSKKGKKHTVNEDKSYNADMINTFNTGLFLVCDGVGGYAGGDIASFKVADKFSLRFSTIRENTSDIEGFISQTINEVNNEIINYAQQNPLYSKLASTLVGLIIVNEKYYSFSVGDSRIYLRDKVGFRQINEDDSRVWERYKAGIIKKSEIIKQTDKNIITAAIGFREQVEPHFYSGSLTGYFQFILCSDGLTDFVTEGDIEKILSQDKSLRDKCSDLIKKALDNGSYDDITVTLIEGDRQLVGWSQ
jgi:protein phosphatase